MARKHHKPEEIVTKLRQIEILVGQGKLVWRVELKPAIRQRHARPGPSCGPRLMGWIEYYNSRRLHLILERRTSNEAYGIGVVRDWPPDDNQNQA